MPSTSLADCAGDLADRFIAVRDDYRAGHPGQDLVITCTWRSEQEQQVLYAQGRTKPGQIVTQIDGVTKKSNHNYKPSRAIDVCVTVGGKAVWTPAEYWDIGPLAEKHGLVWGGSWPHFKDYPHLELKGAA